MPVHDRNGLSHRSVIVGELEITPLPRIQSRSAVMHDLLAVDPRIEPAVAVRRPSHVVNEVIPAVLHDRADLPALGGRAGRAARDYRPRGDGETQPRREVRHIDLEIRLAPRAGVMKVEHHAPRPRVGSGRDRKSTRLNSSHSQISYAVFCLKKKKKHNHHGDKQNTTPLSPRSTRHYSHLIATTSAGLPRQLSIPAAHQTTT